MDLTEIKQIEKESVDNLTPNKDDLFCPSVFVKVTKSFVDSKCYHVEITVLNYPRRKKAYFHFDIGGDMLELYLEPLLEEAVEYICKENRELKTHHEKMKDDFAKHIKREIESYVQNK